MRSNLVLTLTFFVVFQNLENYYLYLVFQELGRHNFKLKFWPTTIEKCMSFGIVQTIEVLSNHVLSLVFIDYVHFLNDSLENLGEIL